MQAQRSADLRTRKSSDMTARWNQSLVVIASLCLSWLGMMASHALRHIARAVLTEGMVVRVVLHPAAISHTDVSAHPAPPIVAWAGPIPRCLIPGLLLLVARCLSNSTGSRSRVQHQFLSSELPADGSTNGKHGVLRRVRVFGPRVTLRWALRSCSFGGSVASRMERFLASVSLIGSVMPTSC